MTKQYKTVKEVMTALLAGKKLTKPIWNDYVYIHILNDAFVDDTGHKTYVSFSDFDDDTANGYFIDYVPKEENWDCWHLGDSFEYRTDNHSYGEFEILFINDEVCFCEKLNGLGYEKFDNIPDSNKKMKKI